jgi:hypothetical protein
VTVRFLRSACILCASLLGTLPLDADPKKVDIKKLEDPALYHAFFKAHTVTDNKIKASDAATAAQLTNTAAALYHITPDDLPNLTAEVRKFNASMGALFLQEQAYLAQQRAAKKAPDVKILMKNQWQRQRLIMNAHGAIHGKLKHSNWAGLYGYINGDFENGLQQGKGNGK